MKRLPPFYNTYTLVLIHNLVPYYTPLKINWREVQDSNLRNNELFEKLAISWFQPTHPTSQNGAASKI